MSNSDDTYLDLSTKYHSHLLKSPVPPSPIPIPVDLANIRISDSLSTSLSFFNSLKSPFPPSSPLQVSPWPPKSSNPIPLISLKLWYKSQRLFLTPLPISINSLKNSLRSLVSSSSGVPLAQTDFWFYFYDYDGEKWAIDSDSDLDSAYRLAQKAIPQVLMLCIRIARGIAMEERDFGDSSDEESERF